MNDWNIQARGAVCEACERPFEDKQPYHTVLYDESTGYRRFDVCERCWREQHSEGATVRKGFVSHWQGLFQVPLPRPEPIRKETAETLLRKLVAQGEEQHRAACYILAVMLERKRILKVKDETRREGVRTFIYEQPSTGDIFTIPDPELRLDQLEEVQRDVAELLAAGHSESREPSVEPGADAPEGIPAAGVSESGDLALR